MSSFREISVGYSFSDGLNYHQWFTTQAIENTLEKLYYHFLRAGSPCFCLRMYVEDGLGQFRPFAGMVPSDGNERPQVPNPVPLEVLVNGTWNWPILAVREGPPAILQSSLSLSNEVRQYFEQITWQVQIRVQQGSQYVGFIKILGRGTPVPEDYEIKAAYFAAATHVASLIGHKYVDEAKTSDEFRTRLNLTLEEIIGLRPHETRLALRHVANMLTSHLGAGWNRAAFFAPIERGTLRCLWAQGGDCTNEWSSRVQRPVGETFKNVAQLAGDARVGPAPTNDCYLTAAAGKRPLEVLNVLDPKNENILARLWRAEGRIDQLPGRYREHEIVFDLDAADQSGAYPGDVASAALITDSDPWIATVRSERPGAEIFTARNGQYFAFPWHTADQKLLGIWLLDLGYWTVPKAAAPNAPTFALTQEILKSLAAPMHAVRGDESDKF